MRVRPGEGVLFNLVNSTVCMLQMGAGIDTPKPCPLPPTLPQGY